MTVIDGVVQDRNSQTYVGIFQVFFFTFEHRVTQKTAELSVVRVNRLMTVQFKCRTETLWTFMSLHVLLKVTFAAELLTNVTHESSAFIV